MTLKITNMDQVYQSCLREYMTGVDRSTRDYKTQEVFTPDKMVEDILRELPEFVEVDSVCLDRAVGDGQFVSKVLIEKMLYLQNFGMTIHDSFVSSLDEIFGVDIELANVELCRERLLCGCTDPEIIELIKRRIINGNCLHPYRRLKSQTDQDHELMKKYFTANLPGVEDPEPPANTVKIKKTKKEPKVKIKTPKVKKTESNKKKTTETAL